MNLPSRTKKGVQITNEVGVVDLSNLNFTISNESIMQ